MTNGAQDSDKYQKIVKEMIPAEIVSVYFLAVQYEYSSQGWLIGVTAFLACVAVVWKLFFSDMNFKKGDKSNNLITSLRLLMVFFTFVVWVFAIGGPFDYIPGVATLTGEKAIILAVWSLIPPLLAKGADKYRQRSAKSSSTNNP